MAPLFQAGRLAGPLARALVLSPSSPEDRYVFEQPLNDGPSRIPIGRCPLWYRRDRGGGAGERNGLGDDLVDRGVRRVQLPGQVIEADLAVLDVSQSLQLAFAHLALYLTHYRAAAMSPDLSYTPNCFAVSINATKFSSGVSPAT